MSLFVLSLAALEDETKAVSPEVFYMQFHMYKSSFSVIVKKTCFCRLDVEMCASCL